MCVRVRFDVVSKAVTNSWPSGPCSLPALHSLGMRPHRLFNPPTATSTMMELTSSWPCVASFTPCSALAGYKPTRAVCNHYYLPAPHAAYVPWRRSTCHPRAPARRAAPPQSPRLRSTRAARPTRTASRAPPPH
eukprot:312759-Chlamydomonas_euryale.AAC.3